MQNDSQLDTSEVSRRSVLRLMGTAGIATSVPLSSAKETTRDGILGSFEGELDDWETNGSNELTLVDEDQRPYAVQSGTNALQITSSDDPYPMIENKTKVRSADFVQNPYLVSDVTVGDYGGDDNQVTFVLRYHYENTGLQEGEKSRKGEQKDRGNSRSGAKPVNVEEKRITVPQPSESRLFWDMSSMSQEKRENPKRLEIGWYRGTEPPKHGLRGDGPGEGMSGIAIFDKIRLTGERDATERSALGNHLQTLSTEHGQFKYRAIEYTEDGEYGEFVFTDGETVDVHWQEFGSDKEKYTIGEESFKLGGGWQ